jgi:hypothetical protein
VSDLDPDVRARLAAAADILIPQAAGMPRASAAGVARAGIDRVLAERPDLQASVELVATWEPAEARERIEMLERDDRLAFAGLLEAVAAAYFLDERVARRLGYIRRDEVLPMVFDDDLDQLTAPVVARGRAYRPA